MEATQHNIRIASSILNAGGVVMDVGGFVDSLPTPNPQQGESVAGFIVKAAAELNGWVSPSLATCEAMCSCLASAITVLDDDHAERARERSQSRAWAGRTDDDSDALEIARERSQIARAAATAWQELRHSARVRGGF